MPQLVRCSKLMGIFLTCNCCEEYQRKGKERSNLLAKGHSRVKKKLFLFQGPLERSLISCCLYIPYPHTPLSSVANLFYLSGLLCLLLSPGSRACKLAPARSLRFTPHLYSHWLPSYYPRLSLAGVVRTPDPPHNKKLGHSKY